MGNSMRPVLSHLRAVAVLGCLCLALFASAAFAQTAERAAGVMDEPYTLQPGDTLVVNVLEDPGLDAEVLVLPDGRISLPIAGTIKAAGMTPQRLASIVKDRLRENFVQPPNVTVRVTSIAEEEDEELNEIYVLGEVANPGRYEYKPEEPITVAQALSLAGGVGPFAARERIQVRELVGDIQVLRLFDYDSFEEGRIETPRDLSDLSDGAVIVVPERGLFE